MNCRRHSANEADCLSQGCYCVWLADMICDGRSLSVEEMKANPAYKWNVTACNAMEKQNAQIFVFFSIAHHSDVRVFVVSAIDKVKLIIFTAFG